MGGVMKFNWLEKLIEFEDNGKLIKLQGVTNSENSKELQEITVERVQK